MRRKWQNRKGRTGRILCPLTAFAVTAAFVIGTPPLSGEAWAVELDRGCAIQVTPVEEGGNPAEGQPGEKVDIAIDLYLVAEAREVDGYDTYDYLIGMDSPYYAAAMAYVQSGEGQGWEYEQDAQGLIFRYSPAQEAEGTGWEGLAREAAAVVLRGEAEIPTAAAGAAGERIADLSPGLYLVVARGSALTEKEEYVTELDTETGDRELATIAYTAGQLYQFMPQLVSVPGKEPENGSITTAGQGEWLYELLGVELKPIVGPRYASLEIVKSLGSYDMPATFVFQVEAVQGEQNVYSDVVSISFDGNSGEAKSVLLEEKIPAGAQVSVTEVYSGAGYELSGLAVSAEGIPQEALSYTVDSGTGQAVIASIPSGSGGTGASARVTFTNEPNGSGNNGGAITNHFERSGADADWNWNQYRYDAASGSWGWNSGLPAVTDTTVR